MVSWERQQDGWRTEKVGQLNFMLYLTGYSLQNYNSATATHVPLLL